MANKKDQKEEWEVEEEMDHANVPNWARRDPKYGSLIERVLAIAPTKTLKVKFPNEAAAIRARNNVRDTIHREKRLAILATRVVKEDDGSARVYFTKLTDEEAKARQVERKNQEVE